MPLTKKGRKVMTAMEDTYGSKDKAESVFYASKNAGKLRGVDRSKEGKDVSMSKKGAKMKRKKS
jgi:hypothetical protein